jgi:spermidine/putrescine transport system permease protein/putrescine transport system permease protein
VHVLLTVWGVGVLVFLYLPVGTMVAYSFNAGRSLLAWDRFGLDAYGSAFADDALVASVVTSLEAAVGSALLAALLGSLAGIGLARHRGGLGRLLTVLVLLVLVTPEIVDAVGLLVWFVHLGGPFGPANQVVSYGLVRLWFGQALFSTAVVTLIVRARVAALDPALEEAAADLYAPPVRRLRQVTLPLVLPAVLAGGMLAFSLSLDNTVISSFVSVAGATPWSVFVFSAVRNVLRPEIAAMSTVLLLVTVVSLLLVGRVLRRAGSDGLVSTVTAG